MPTSDFKAFAIGGGANVVSQATYAASAVLTNGFQSGICPSQYYNKALRQANFITAALSEWLVSKGYNVPDDGNSTNIINNMIDAWTVPAETVTPSNTVTFTNKTISGASNTITNVSLTGGITDTLGIANGGTNRNNAIGNNQLMGYNGSAYIGRNPFNVNIQIGLTGGASGSPTALIVGYNSAEINNSTNEYILPAGIGGDIVILKNKITGPSGAFIIQPPATGTLNGSASSISVATGGSIMCICSATLAWDTLPGSAGWYT